MARDERERIGPFVITTAANVEPGKVVCARCGRVLALVSENGALEPPFEELMAAERVPVPNFGWFCDQKCGSDYERAFRVPFQRDSRGKISYDPKRD